MRKTRVHWPTTAALTVAIVLAWAGWEFGDYAMRYHLTAAAIEALESCDTDLDCERALVMLESAKGGR